MASSSSSSPLLLALVDALPRVLPFLSGFDLLPLSHVNKRFYSELLGANSAIWTRHAPRALRSSPDEWRELATFGWDRVDPVVESDDAVDPEAARQSRRVHKARLQRERAARADELRAHSKRRYLTSVSLQFSGLRDYSDDAPRRREVGSVVLIRQGISLGERWAPATFSLSFDLWLALLPPPASSDGVAGGVVFSAYSHTRLDAEARAAVAHFVHADPHGALYCSVASGDKRVVATLALSRWYHLALTFDRSDDHNAVQRVYLDGECIDTRHGVTLLETWPQLTRYQLGTGLVDEHLVGTPATRDASGFRSFLDAVRGWRRAQPHFCGNYSFHGLLDEFRLWRDVLTPSDIQELSHGRDDPEHVRATCDWSLTVHGDYNCFYGDLWAVQCTRPSERMCLDVRPAFRVWGVKCRPHHRFSF